MTQTNLKHPSNADPRRDQLGNILENHPVQNQGLRRWLTVFLGGLTVLASIGFIVLLGINTWDRINIHGRAVLLNVIFYPAILYAGKLSRRACLSWAVPHDTHMSQMQRPHQRRTWRTNGQANTARPATRHLSKRRSTMNDVEYGRAGLGVGS